MVLSNNNWFMRLFADTHNKPWQFAPGGAGLATLAAAQGR
jgi:hypothetical protein